ncbi:hypothetical protein L584_02545 [Pantoea agglomerans Tx10]|nr:hypothetical protein L584_02545 [Pantoea agglomerans Tx10]
MLRRTLWRRFSKPLNRIGYSIFSRNVKFRLFCSRLNQRLTGCESFAMLLRKPG